MAREFVVVRPLRGQPFAAEKLGEMTDEIGAKEIQLRYLSILDSYEICWLPAHAVIHLATDVQVAIGRMFAEIEAIVAARTGKGEADGR